VGGRVEKKGKGREEIYSQKEVAAVSSFFGGEGSLTLPSIAQMGRASPYVTGEIDEVQREEGKTEDPIQKKKKKTRSCARRRST